MVKEMKNMGIEPRLLCPPQSPLAQKAAEAGINVSEICLDFFKKGEPLPYIRSVISISKEVKKFKPDLIHAQGANSLHWLMPFALFGKIPICCKLQDFEVSNRFSLWALRKIPVVFTDSEALRKRVILTYKINGNKCLTIRPGIEPLTEAAAEPVRAMRKRLGLGPSDIAVGICSRIHPRKGQHLFLKAVDILKEETSIKWIIAGDRETADLNYLEELDTLINNYRLDSRVSFTGFISDLPVFLSALDIVTVPSQEEPFGLISIDAQAQSRPVIVSNQGGLPESVEDGLTGIVMRKLDAIELARQVMVLASDPEYRRRMGRAGQKRIAQGFTIRQNALKIIEQYKILAGP
ncbi:glycosyltransferase family 4 protein [candidate division TA06 bacterium]|nr:glycosyltransferase family 4 protein [candidate division TA06 bacterium]